MTTRRVVTIDIETLPAQGPALAAYIASSGAKAAEENAKSALNGDFGRLLCIGYISEDRAGIQSSGVIGWDEVTGRFSCDERTVLVEFWEMMRGFRPDLDRIVGHNIFDFDLKFIYKRSVVQRVPPTVELSFARYRSRPIFDTMCEWERWSYGSRVKLDRLARVLTLPTSKTEDIDGSRVYELFQQGHHRLIRDYCMRDVELTRAIYRRMTFAESITPVASDIQRAPAVQQSQPSGARGEGFKTF